MQTSAVYNSWPIVCPARCVEQRLAFALQKVGKGRLTLKKEQLSAIRSAYDQEDAFAWLLTGFGKWIEYKRSPFLFHHKLNRLDGRASSVVLVVSPTKACILGRVGGRSKTTFFFLQLIYIVRGWPARARPATGAERE